MFYVGLDVHSNRSSLEILDHDGKRIKRLEVRGPWSALEATVAQIPTPFAVCYEASCGYGHLHDRFSRTAARVVVAHPRHLRLIYRTKRKNDRVDAAKLAKLLYLDMVPPVHVPKLDVRACPSTGYLDVNAANPNVGTSDPRTISTTANDTFIIGAFRLGVGTSSAGAGFTAIFTSGFGLLEYKIVSSPQSALSVPVGTGAGTSNGGIAAAFVMAPAASPSRMRVGRVGRI